MHSDILECVYPFSGPSRVPVNGFKEGSPLSRDVVSSILFIDKRDLTNCQILTYKSDPGRTFTVLVSHWLK